MPVVACPDCGTIQRIPALEGGGSLACAACGRVLERATGRSLDASLACAVATFALLFPANLMTLLRVSILGAERHSVLASGALVMWRQGWALLGLGVMLQGVLLPFLRFGLLALVLAQLRAGRRGGWLGRGFRWSERLDLWAMPDVYLIGCAVGYSRVAPFLPVRIGAGGWCFIGAAFLSLVTRAAIDRRAVWQRIADPVAPPGPDAIACTECHLVAGAEREGAPCARCGARLHARKPFAIPRAAALIAAGMLLYPVANVIAMSAQYRLGHRVPHTIFDGVMQLLRAGFWPLAAVIFTTSVAIPLVKLLGLTWCMVSVHYGSRRRLLFRTRLYRFVHEVGRWSNVDVFTIALFLPLMQFPPFLVVRADGGATAFLAVIVLTMFAARAFDPRLMWDAARRAA